MSLFGRLFSKKPVTAADDPVFGHITFEHAFWTFIPTPPTEGFMVTVRAPASGPTPLQRDFFQKIRADLPDFEQRARDFMRSRVDRGVNVSSLSVYSVEIGSEEESRQQRFVLEMGDEQADIVHRVSFAGDEPVGYGFDC